MEILRRNLLPEIQHELLNLQISSLQQLRNICRRREHFMQDIRRKHGVPLSRNVTSQKKVSELGLEGDTVHNLPTIIDEEIAAINLVCWNCRKHGHRYQDCVSERTIFCYGCGAPDTYKPNCKKCDQKNVRLGVLNSAPKQMRPTEADSQ